MFSEKTQSFRFSLGITFLLLCALLLCLSSSLSPAEAESRSDPPKVLELQPGESHVVTIYANKLWQDSGLLVKEGETYTITAEGKWSVGPICGESDADGTGVNAICIGDEKKTGWRGSALIGKIWWKGRVSKKAKAFKVGTHLDLSPETEGPLYLRAAFLDQFDFVNYGSMKVTITRTDGYVPPREEVYVQRQQPPQVRPLSTQKPTTGNDTTPPAITLITPRENRGVVVLSRQEVSIIGLATDESPILAVLVNDVEAELNRIQGGVNFKFTLQGNMNQDKLTIKAIDQYGNVAKKELFIDQQKTQTQRTQTPVVTGAKPNLWILAIGISQYKDSSLNLKYADNDARTIAETLKKQEGKLYGEVNYQLLLNEKGTRENILEGIGRYLGMAGYDDVVLIFMAGHGVKDKQTDSYYFLPYDASPDTLMTRGLLWSTFDEAQKRLAGNVSKVMLWLDTCHAGAMKVAMRGAEAGEELSQVLRSGEGTFILAASKPGEESEESKDFLLEGEKTGHGAFTYALLKGLEEGDMDADKSVSISELSSYVAKQVPRVTRGRQHPYFRLSGTDIPLSMK